MSPSIQKSRKLMPILRFVIKHHSSITAPEMRKRVAPIMVGGMCRTATLMARNVEPHRI
ncbi:hypothetical protein D3C83_310850 [compost metagenome]